MLNLLRRAPEQPQRVSATRSAEVMLTAYARTHRGLFILDGEPVGGEGPPNALTVYCVFRPEFRANAMAAARNAFGATELDVTVEDGSTVDGTLLTYITRRGKVIGERRGQKR